jgi:hypothetical protein
MGRLALDPSRGANEVKRLSRLGWSRSTTVTVGMALPGMGSHFPRAQSFTLTPWAISAGVS